MQSQTLNPQQNPELQQALDSVSRAAMNLEALFQARSDGYQSSAELRTSLQVALRATKEIREMLQG